MPLIGVLQPCRLFFCITAVYEGSQYPHFPSSIRFLLGAGAAENRGLGRTIQIMSNQIINEMCDKHFSTIAFSKDRIHAGVDLPVGVGSVLPWISCFSLVNQYFIQ